MIAAKGMAMLLTNDPDIDTVCPAHNRLKSRCRQSPVRDIRCVFIHGTLSLSGPVQV